MINESFKIEDSETEFKEAQPFSKIFNDVYHSNSGALKEAEHVFIVGNQLKERWQYSNNFNIAELGFGFGISFLAAASAWLEGKSSGVLNFLSIEAYPQSKESLEEYYDKISGSLNHKQNNILRQIIRSYPKLVKGFHRINLIDEKINLTLIFQPIDRALDQIHSKINAWFLDGFSPSKNPEMWSDKVFEKIYGLSSKNTTFSTYSVSRSVKDAATKAGFEISIVNGFGNKKENLVGVKKSDETILNTKKNLSIAVIGGGISGVSNLLSLCNRNYKVDLFEAKEDLAMGASGNKSAVIMPLLSSKIDELSEYFLSGYLYTLRALSSINQQEKLKSLNLKGSLRLANVKKWQTVLSRINQLGLNPITQILDKNEIIEKFKFDSQFDGLFFQDGGAVEPKEIINAIVKIYSKQSNIFLNTEIKEFLKTDDGFELIDNKGIIRKYDAVIIANGYSAAYFNLTSWLPVEKIKGQLFSAKISENSKLIEIDHPICYDGYITPIAESNRVIVGATYEHNKHEEEFDEKVLEDLSLRLYNNTGAKLNNKIEGKVCFRTTSPDRLPIVGELYEQNGSKVENAFVSLGHGSRGMISCFIAAEVIADSLSKSINPLPKHILNSISPLRYLLREKKRGVSTQDSYPASYIWR